MSEFKKLRDLGGGKFTTRVSVDENRCIAEYRLHEGCPIVYDVFLAGDYMKITDKLKPYQIRKIESVIGRRVADKGPDLLVVLKAVEKYMTDCGYFASNKALATQVRSAIAKAEGR